MATFYKILILCAGFALSCYLRAESPEDHEQANTCPLEIIRHSDGSAYYWINNRALDLDKADYSDLYETYLTPVEGQPFEDCTRLFIDGKLRLEPTFLKTYQF